MRTAEEYFGHQGMLSKVFNNYEPREEQLQFSKDIHEAIEKKVPFIGEANTGVGKSLAALSAAATIIEKTGKPVLIVTSSILLQEQYMDKDIPIISQATDFNYSPVLAKGKGNYLCPSKLVERQFLKLQPQKVEEADKIFKWAATTNTGDFSELSFQPSRDVIEKFSIVEENECSGKRCPLFKNCYYYNNLKAIQASKIIVCNYHFLFTALQTGNMNMLPDEVGAVIFDEVHEIVNITQSITEVKLHNKDFAGLNSHLAHVQRKLKEHEDDVRGGLGFAEDVELSDFMHDKKVFHAKVTDWVKTKLAPNESKFIITESFKREFENLVGEYINHLTELITNIENFLEWSGIDMEALFNDGYNDFTTEWYMAISRYLDGVRERLVKATEMARNDIKRDNQIVWVDYSEGMEFAEIIRKPFDVSGVVGPVFKGIHPMLEGAQIIGMSATLTTNRTFEHIKRQLGLEFTEVKTSVVKSPFNLTENMLWYLPEGVPDGTDPLHADFVLAEMERIISLLGGRTMCLFTSHRQMQYAAQFLTRHFKNTNIKILVQGEQTKKHIVQEMRDNNNVVIVGTRSFFTGVDIQGDNLQAVLIDKLPFPIAGEPVNIHLMNQPSGFTQHAIPELSLVLKQGFGRLIRSKDDSGVVAVFDGRLRSASYKSKIFNSFNFKLNTTTDYNKVVEFLTKQ